MANPNTVKIEAKSLEQAIVKAAGQLGITQDEVAYEVTKQDTQKGLLSFFKSPTTVINAWNKAHGKPAADLPDCCKPEKAETSAPRSNRSSKTSAPVRDSEPLSDSQVDDLVEELRSFCAGICERVAGEFVEVKAKRDEDRLVLDIASEYMAQQITKNTKLAEALEHILRKKPRHLRQELPFRIFVDVGGHRKDREQELVQMAFDLSAKVHENKRPIVLNYKSSYDRKIIHMALDKDDRVYTKSIGSGPNRKLMILPVKDGQPAEQHA